MTPIWEEVSTILPPEGVPVATISPGGMEQVLVRRGRLWYVHDESMYVYYVPKLWRTIPFVAEGI